MKRKNWWNIFFFPTTVEEEEVKYRKFKKLLGLYPEISERLVNCKNLMDLLAIHKEMWKKGFRNNNIGPCEYGMFRCTDIETMTPDQVFLGDIYGLWTHDITFWEKDKEETYGVNGYGIAKDTKIYDLIVDQYRSHLRNNLKAIKGEAESYIEEYEELNVPEDPYKVLL